MIPKAATRTPPTKDGWYWYWEESANAAAPEIAAVEGGEVCFTGSDKVYAVPGHGNITDFDIGPGWWLEIQPPQ